MTEKRSVEEMGRDAIRNHMQCSTTEEAINMYDQLGTFYDEYTAALHFKGPAVTASSAAQILGDNLDARILDVGAGSGNIGLELAKLGFRSMDAADASAGLLEVAKSKGVYTKLFCQYVGLGQPLPMEKGTYDMVVMSGAFAQNLLPKEALVDIIRVVKPGGHIVNTLREAALSMPHYGDGLEPYMKKLEHDGLWKEIDRTMIPNLIDDFSGIIFVHRVL